ncbi:unnamed protein product [Didymodactylos carnosus]|uniref:Uncharacterized protein n=1 Tax=Didymodactylos carnosus TaxID=1234261 RepID=A0A8S2FH22_9BILA|nr:unnamed protein product [Didymodactylos carnosus]CAF4259176.1 unnamed protein product [Didymodactylos carnosus]
MSRRQQPADPLLDVYQCVSDNKDFDTVYDDISAHPEWLTTFANGKNWSVLHHIVDHGNVQQLERLLELQSNNIQFRLLTKTKDDNLTVLDIAKRNSTKHPAMFQRIDRLVKMDELLNHAKERQWPQCKQLIQGCPEILNEKPPYRKYYVLHHIGHVGDRRFFDELHNQYKFDLNLSADKDKTVCEIANENGHQDFASYVKQLRSTQSQILERSNFCDATELWIIDKTLKI